jgi:ribosomal protein L14
MNQKVERLQKGETFVTKEHGNSMIPLIYSGQPHRLAPATLESVNVGDIVYCKVKGSFLTHLVKAKDVKRGVLIANNKGRINGWTKQVYGKVIEVLPMTK